MRKQNVEKRKRKLNFSNDDNIHKRKALKSEGRIYEH